ncbi:MAG: hypothetical protein KJ583_05790 [Nanoarchaeota archaeon]|nr:hypothetical protein [Nanoarchaeota archaeon]MBU1270437.1 hypothetical protein [Nanoarchaeota archaeon]MBU1604798.1 hypothetical protein [Nanoarchaeota archaeon]MBU2443216.1 hypothetical protein [Nanoarchaeota archaeon]
MKITKERLTEKGWSEEEIDKTMAILHRAKHNIHPHTYLLNKSIYWIALVLIILGNFIFSIMLIPLILTLSTWPLYLIILLIALSFGVIMSVIIKDIEDLEAKHHLIILLVVPIIAIINFFIVVNVVNNDLLTKVLNHYHNPLIVGLVYLSGFMLSYSYLIFEEKWK